MSHRRQLTQVVRGRESVASLMRQSVWTDLNPLDQRLEAAKD